MKSVCVRVRESVRACVRACVSVRGTVRGDASEIRKHAREEKKGRVSVRVCV